MSQENVEVVRRAFAAWNTGDTDAVREMLDPDIVLRVVKEWPEPGPFVGREAVMRFYTQLRDTWDDDTVETIGEFTHGADRVVVRWTWHRSGRGPQTDMESTIVYSVRKGKIHEMEYFWDHEEALEAAGLGLTG
jgi:ketosteroid isomerase-like protein